jgi:hypothetical protein
VATSNGILIGGPSNVYAVIEFVPIDDKITQVTFYDYAGMWIRCWEEIKQVILAKEK